MGAVVEKLGSTNFVAVLSQLKHAVSSVKPVPANVIEDSIETGGRIVSGTSGTFNVAPASRPMPIAADATMCVRFGKMCERSPFEGLEEFRFSQLALTLLSSEMETESVGRSRNMPACMSPSPERIFMPRRTSARRPRERVMVMPSKEAEKGMAVMVD
jgi:hypothetical protein